MLAKWVAAGFVILALGAILVLVSQMTFKTEYYGLVDTVSISAGQPLEFCWTFEGNKSYRFEVETLNWTYPSPYIHCMSVSKGTLVGGGENGLISPPYVWYWQAGFNTTTLRVAWWHFGDNYSRIVETPNASAHVTVSELKEKASQPTELVYVGAPLIAIGAALILIIEHVHRRRAHAKKI
jgi:hypothetical protein